MENYFEYHVKSGDTLSAIIFKMFGYAPSDSKYSDVLTHIVSLNPQIKNPNEIIAGDMLRLGVIPGAKTVSVIRSTPASSELEIPSFITKNVTRADIENFWVLSSLAENSNYLTIPGGVAIGVTGNLMSPGNIALIKEVGDLYAEYKRGDLTKGQYDYRRSLVLNRFKENVGPMEKLLFGDKTTHQSIRIAKGGGLPATAHIAKHADRLNDLAKISKVGGIALVGVGVTASCMQIANADSHEEKNEIFVETVASTSVGVGAGVVVGLFLVSNPIGWGTALVLAVGGAAISYGSGKLARYAYDKSGNKVDFVSGAGINKICRY